MRMSPIPPEIEAMHPGAEKAVIGPPPGISRSDCGDADMLIDNADAEDGMGATFRAYFRPDADELLALLAGGYVRVHLRGMVVPFGANVVGLVGPEHDAPVLFRGDANDPQTLDEVIGQAVGAASACWENLEGTGVFDSTRAKKIVDEVLDWIRTVHIRGAVE